MNPDYVRDEIGASSTTRLRCSDALASARHRQNCYLQGCEPRWMIFIMEERSYELSLRGMAREAIDCAVPHAPLVLMSKLLQEREITLAGYPEEYG